MSLSWLFRDSVNNSHVQQRSRTFGSRIGTSTLFDPFVHNWNGKTQRNLWLKVCWRGEGWVAKRITNATLVWHFVLTFREIPRGSWLMLCQPWITLKTIINLISSSLWQVTADPAYYPLWLIAWEIFAKPHRSSFVCSRQTLTRHNYYQGDHNY